MGKAFGEDFLEKSAKAEERKEWEDLIQKWCKFDISGGWGFWNSKGDEISVKNSFFVEMDKDCEITDGGSAPHCVIMRGYIAGVLEAFSAKLGVNATCDVRETKCGIHDITAGKAETECTFTWRHEEQSFSPE